MDVERLHVVLQQSFSPDAAIRKPAEDTMRNLKNVPGSVQLLLQVIAEKQVRFEVRQAAAIQLKNICRECWAERTHYGAYGETLQTDLKVPILSDADKAAVKQGLIRAMLGESEKSLRDLMSETLHTVVIHDFPDKWPDLVPTLLQTIQQGVADLSQHGLAVHNALLALRKVCKRYEYKSKDQRGPLNEIVRAAFPLLLPLGTELSQPHQQSLEGAMMLKQILKIFWSSTQFYLPSYDANSRPEDMQPWFDIVTRALQKPLPEASTGLEPKNQPTDIDQRNAWPWWKVKKWSVQIMSRLFSRYGVPSYAEDDSGKAFAIYFSTHVAPQFLGPVCETLNLKPSGQFCTHRVIHLALTFVDLAVELASTYKLLKPHLDFLMFQVCFPTMCLTTEDVETFDNDPVEFVHKQNSPLADFYDPRMSAITLVKDLVKHRGQDVTQKLLGRTTEILTRYSTTPVEQRNHVEKDGALLTFGSLSSFLLAKEKYASQLEGLLVSFVFPDFNSPIAFLRYRACWMIQQFSSVKWSDDGSTLRQLIELVLHRLKDPALPVQIEASIALRFLIDVDGAEHTLLPVLPQLLTEYFRIMNEIGNDEVVSALQVLLDKFGDHIEPHAMALVTQLTNTFTQYCAAGEDEDDDDAALAASQCLECIATVLKGVCNKESMMKSLEPALLPLVLKILGNDGDFIEYLESALDILSFLTYFQSQISMEVWQCFPLIYVAFDQWAYDYLNMMVPCLQSYISKSPEVFLAGVAQLPEGNISYLDLVVSMVTKTVTNDRASEAECRFALSLFMTILNHCPGRVNPYISFMNEVVLGKLGEQLNKDIPTTRFSVYQALGSALYYHPELELVEMEKRQVTGQVCVKWMEDIAKMEKWLPRKLTVLGFGSLFLLPTSGLPPSIVGILPQILHHIVHLSLLMKVELEKETTDKEKTQNGDDDAQLASNEVVGDLDQGFDENEDVTNEVDEAYRKALVGDLDDDMAKFLLGDWDDDDGDFDEDYTSPLDQIDQLIFLSDTLQAAFQREPEAYKQVRSAMPAESVAACQQLFSTAENMRAQAAAVVAASAAGHPQHP